MFLVVTACSEDECGGFEIAADQIRFADSIEENGITYYLYTKTTGWHDKIIYFQLYDNKPEFKCRRSNIKPIYVIHYDDYPEMKYVKALTLQLNQDEKLNITYTTDKREGVDAYDVKFTHQDGQSNTD
jgi:hypothetical protein